MTRAELPVLSVVGERRQARLTDARLVVTVDAARSPAELEMLLTACCSGSADAFLLRDKTATEEVLRAAAPVFRRVSDENGTLFLVNDLPGLARQVEADGVHVGQEDVPPDHARHVMGPDLLVGRTVTTRAEIDATRDEDVDYLLVRPADRRRRHDDFATCLSHAAGRAAHPWFALSGPTMSTAGDVIAAGARRIVAGQLVTAAEDPTAVTWELRRLLAESR